MSTYVEVYGNIKFVTVEEKKKAFDWLVSNEWIVTDAENTSMWQSDGEDVGYPVDRGGLLLEFNGGVMRNVGVALRHVLSDFKINKEETEYRTVCLDGMFALSEYDDSIGCDIDISDEEFKKIIGCDASDIVYDYDLDDEDNPCLIVNAEQAAFEWVVYN